MRDVTWSVAQLSLVMHPPKHPHKGSVRWILFNDMLLITDHKHQYKVRFACAHLPDAFKSQAIVIDVLFSGSL